MAKKRSQGGDGLLAAIVAVVMALAWLWSHWWGRGLLILAAVAGVWATIEWIRGAPARRRQELERLATLQGLLQLSPSAFEHAIGKLLTEHGFTQVRVSGGAGDLQADITCRDPEGQLTVVQCKRYLPGNAVSSPTMQSFIGMAFVHHRAARAIFATTSSFTAPAIALASQHGVHAWGGGHLVSLSLGRLPTAARPKPPGPSLYACRASRNDSPTNGIAPSINSRENPTAPAPTPPVRFVRLPPTEDRCVVRLSDLLTA